MNETIGPARGGIWICGVLLPLVLNLGAILLFGTYYALRATNPSSASIVLSALSFAAIHGVFLIDKVALTFILGLGAGLYFVRERNLLPLMFSHWVADVWTFGLSVGS